MSVCKVYTYCRHGEIRTCIIDCIQYLHHFGFLDWLHATCRLFVQSLVRISKALCHQRASSIILESEKPGEDTHNGSCTLQRHNIRNLSKSDSHGISACKFMIVHQLRHSFQLFMLSNSYGATLASRVGGPIVEVFIKLENL